MSAMRPDANGEATPPARPPDLALRSALFADLYEFTMAQAYVAEGLADAEAVFELHFRTLPRQRNFVVAAGLEDVLTCLERWRFEPDDLAFLRGLGTFREDFLERLSSLRFTGDVYAVAEGTVVFAHEPLVQIVAPMLEAQLVETVVLNQVHVHSVIASKAARVVAAAAGRPVVDFGSRRAHGTDAALKTARASYLAGAAGTSNVLAGRLLGIPLYGTMAHSFIQAYESEARAFEAFARLYPGTTLLVDTFDTLRGVRRAIDVARRLRPPARIGAIRLDSGDLARLAREARRMLDEAGLRDVKIFASSALDEYAIAGLLASGAPLDGFGVGTRLATSADAPALDMAYKLVSAGGRPVLKLSDDKHVYPARKQVWRCVEDGRPRGDVIGRHDETLPGEPLLRPVMLRGARTSAGRVTLEQARAHARAELARLPDALRSLEPSGSAYDVRLSPGLRAAFDRLRGPP